LSNVAGKAEAKVDSYIGACWHLMAHYTDALWHDLEWSSAVQVQQAQVTRATRHNLLSEAAQARATAAAAGAHSAEIKRLEREFKGIDAKVREIERDISKGIGNDIRLHIKALEQELTKIEDQTIPAINSRVGTLDGAIGTVEGWLDLPTDLTKGQWEAGIVGAGLAALGLAGLTSGCNPLTNNNQPCNWWNDLSGLLQIFAAIGIAYDFKAFVQFVESVAGDVEALVKEAA
jgi:hypothetical protein